MSKVVDLTELSPKKLRTLRNNLNNRLESFSTSGEGAKELQKSHVLFGKTEGECAQMLIDVLREIKRRSRA
ncbi:MAG: hypothetical protein K2P81_09890 [Bacteriovoracaceae bacterium]|nr:hypothetical protein [Bacteriovoracaceae bacterium]